MTFVVASSGCGQYEWTEAPPWDLWGSSDWYAKLHYNFGFTAAFLGTSAHWFLSRAVVRHNRNADSFAPLQELAFAAGAAFVAVSFVAAAPFVVICETLGFAGAMNGDCRRDTRLVPESALNVLASMRHGFWLGVGGLGVVLMLFAAVQLVRRRSSSDQSASTTQAAASARS